MKNTSYALIFSWFFLLLTFPAYAQDSLRIMSYNLLMYPGGTSYSRQADLQYVLQSYTPDILGVCELETEQAADDILTGILQNINPDFRRGRFEMDHSNPNGTLHQLIFYNNAKLELVRQGYVTTQVRDINHYTFRLRTATGDTLDVYELHLKASSGTTNEQKRHNMILRLEQSLDSLPASRYVIVMGDFNLYNSSEPAYTEMTDPNHHITLLDAANRPGSWHNNSAYADVHTQSTHRNNNAPYDNFVGGGLDDRFDLIMLSGNLLDDTQSLHYRTGSFMAYGNNGNCFNGNINDSNCSGTFSQTLRNHLFEVSDHLPVVLTLVSTQNFAVNTTRIPQIRIFPNPAGEYVYWQSEAIPGQVEIYAPTGQKVLQCQAQAEKCYIGRLKPGLYYVHFQGMGLAIPLVKR